MKAHLLYRDADFDLDGELPVQHEALTQDLALDQLWDAMAAGDPFMCDVARRVLLTSLQTPEEISYRQDVLADCLRHPDPVRQLYQLAGDAVEGERKIYHVWYKSPDAILTRSIRAMEFFLDQLRTLRDLAAATAPEVVSDGWRDLCATLAENLDDAYFQEVRDHLKLLRFKGGVPISATLGAGLRGTGLTLDTPAKQPGWRDHLPFAEHEDARVLRIPDRDDAGLSYLGELRDRGVNLAADALARACDHILSFFTMLRCETAFYCACLNLHQQLTDRGRPCCRPDPAPPGAAMLECEELYDPCLALRSPDPVVGNQVTDHGADLIVVTGANQGGKSTFLRSVGIAQLMLQAGMFTPAASLRADVRAQVLSHFKREEDDTMTSGKFDEELARMSELADHARPGAMVLFNESFASTNEREGSEIARQIVRALLETGIKVVYVTHLYDLAHTLYLDPPAAALFLRAPREGDGTRTYRLVEGEPLPTSYGEDLYQQVFGTPVHEPAPQRAA